MKGNRREFSPKNFKIITVACFLFLLTACERNTDKDIGDLYKSDVPQTGVDGTPPNDSIVEIPDLQPLPQFVLSDVSSPVIENVMADSVGITQRVSIGDNEEQSLANSISASVSANGRYVAFDSIAFNLIAGDNNGTWDIFVRDRLLQTTRRVSVSPDGASADGASVEPIISDDGLRMVFESSAGNLVADDLNNVRDIFYADLAANTLRRVSVAADGGEADDESKMADLSGNGRYVVFESLAGNLTSADTNQVSDIYLHDTQTATTERVSLTWLNEQADGASFNPSVSDDGRFIVFESEATNLVEGDTNGVADIFLRDRQNKTTHRLNINANVEQANGPSTAPKISGDGSVVIFHSNATNLVADDNNEVGDMFALDLDGNALERISVNTQGEEAAGSVFRSNAISFNGRYVLFYSSASNLSAGDDNNSWDVFLRDRVLNTTTRISVSSDNLTANAHSFEPALSAGGHYAVFGSNADNLVSDDTNSVWDTFIRSLRHVNFTPIAEAGLDQQIFLGESVELDGSASSDPDGDSSQLHYAWHIEMQPVASNAMLPQSNSAQFTFTPDVAGDYVISLRVNDGETDSQADEVLISVLQNLPPEAHISVSQISGSAPLTVQFSADDSFDPEDGALIYLWQFGDGGDDTGVSNVSNTSHTYRQPGVYTVVLTVTDDVGQIDQAMVEINVTAANNPPSVMVSADVTGGAAPLTVNFSADATDIDNDTLTYNWDFGDGNISTLQNPTHIYHTSGVFEARVTVSDGEFSVEDSVRVVVSEAQAFSINVLQLKIELRNRRDVEDKLSLKAALLDHNVQLSDDDFVRVDINSSTVFAVPFGEFMAHRRDEKTWIYQGEHVRAVLDLAQGKLKLRKDKQMLRGAFNPDSPVTVSVSLGNTTASQQVSLQRIDHDTCNKEDDEHDHHDDDDDDDSKDHGHKLKDDDHDEKYSSHDEDKHHDHHGAHDSRDCDKIKYVYPQRVHGGQHGGKDKKKHEEDGHDEDKHDDRHDEKHDEEHRHHDHENKREGR